MLEASFFSWPPSIRNGPKKRTFASSLPSVNGRSIACYLIALDSLPSLSFFPSPFNLRVAVVDENL